MQISVDKNIWFLVHRVRGLYRKIIALGNLQIPRLQLCPYKVARTITFSWRQRCARFIQTYWYDCDNLSNKVYTIFVVQRQDNNRGHVKEACKMFLLSVFVASISVEKVTVKEMNLQMFCILLVILHQCTAQRVFCNGHRGKTSRHARNPWEID